MKYLFLLLPILYTSANAYLFWRMWQAMSALPIWARVVLSALFWIVAFALFTSIGLRNTAMPEIVLRSCFQVGSIWMVLLLYMLLFLAVLALIKHFLPAMGNTLWWAMAASIVLMIYGYCNYQRPKVEHLQPTLERPLNEEQVRIVAISDVHLGYGTNHRALERYVHLINEQKPDVILIAGDLIDNSVQPLLKAPFAAVLQQLKAPMGIYMVPGNHEYISRIEDSEAFLQNTPIQLLRDSIVSLPCGLQIVGRDDKMNSQRKSLDELLSLADRNQPMVVLDHQPYDLAQTDALKVDLQISGHTHRGQVWPLSWLTDKMYEQSHGYRKWSYSHIWVSSGLSLWGPPFRIGTKSDLAVIDLK